ncbi:MAG: hypothetical protein DRI69_08360 [Bacteroidetes bacterium]|nr:MAG: hypothetical protein DRI69_08360 [Bacteroidota bacterium]
MMTEEQRIERIESYLSGEMSQEDKVSFESELTQDQDLREEVALHRKADRAIAYLNEKQLKQRLQTITAGQKASASGGRMRKLVIRLSIAASIVLLATWSVLITTDYFDQNASLADLSEEFFVPTQPEVFRGEDAQDKSSYTGQLIEADLMYQSGDFEGAIAEYKRLSLNSNTLNDRAEWNLAMSYLLSESHQGEFDALLDQITGDTTHMYHERALSLLEEL